MLLSGDVLVHHEDHSSPGLSNEECEIGTDREAMTLGHRMHNWILKVEVGWNLLKLSRQRRYAWLCYAQVTKSISPTPRPEVILMNQASGIFYSTAHPDFITRTCRGWGIHYLQVLSKQEHVAACGTNCHSFSNFSISRSETRSQDPPGSQIFLNRRSFLQGAVGGTVYWHFKVGILRSQLQESWWDEWQGHAKTDGKADYALLVFTF